MKSKKPILIISLFVLCAACVSPIGLAYLDPGEGGGDTLLETYTDSATHRASWGDLWVETTLNVEIRLYSSGRMTFSYSASYRYGTAWYVLFSVATTSLSYQSPGLKTAKHYRTFACYFPLIFFWDVVIDCRVHFNENDFTFYYSELVWDNSEQAFKAWIRWLDNFKWVL